LNWRSRAGSFVWVGSTQPLSTSILLDATARRRLFFSQRPTLAVEHDAPQRPRTCSRSTLYGVRPCSRSWWDGLSTKADEPPCNRRHATATIQASITFFCSIRRPSMIAPLVDFLIFARPFPVLGQSDPADGVFFFSAAHAKIGHTSRPPCRRPYSNAHHGRHRA